MKTDAGTDGRGSRQVGGPRITVQSIDGHRNGISGAPFHAVIFTDANEPGHTFLATVFEAPGTVAVVDVKQAAEGDIEFGSNSWRGDRFEPALRRAIRAYDREQR